MQNAIETQLVDSVLARMTNAQDPRFKQVMTSLIRHLHAFVRETEPTEAEWLAGIQFLTATGRKCDDRRQEFILLSDTLGVSMLVDAINHRKPGGATESTVLGPFYVPGAAQLPMWSDIAKALKGVPAYVSGIISDVNGTPGNIDDRMRADIALGNASSASMARSTSGGPTTAVADTIVGSACATHRTHCSGYTPRSMRAPPPRVRS